MTLHYDSPNELPEHHRGQVISALRLDSDGIKPSGNSKRRKYGNQPTPYNRVIYQSKKEANRAMELDLELKAGTVLWWCRQPEFVLPGGIIYRPDFIVCRPLPITAFYTETETEVEDVKSKPTKTPEYRMKKKLLKATYGIEIKEK